jgi:hypothetical protein
MERAVPPVLTGQALPAVVQFCYSTASPCCNSCLIGRRVPRIQPKRQRGTLAQSGSKGQGMARWLDPAAPSLAIRAGVVESIVRSCTTNAGRNHLYCPSPPIAAEEERNYPLPPLE